MTIPIATEKVREISVRLIKLLNDPDKGKVMG